MSTKINNISKKQEFNIHDLQSMPINQLISVLEKYCYNTDHPEVLIDRIVGPLLERCRTISELGLWYLNLSRVIERHYLDERYKT